MAERYPAHPWAEILGHYRNLVQEYGWESLRPMLGLVEALVASPYVARLSALTSMDQLRISRTRTIHWNHQELVVQFDPVTERFVFTYYEASLLPKPWTTSCTADEGFAKLERILLKRLRWFKKKGADGYSSATD